MSMTDLSVVPVQQLLEGSVYYPACGYDGRVVQYTAGHAHSFVYVDARLPHDEVCSAIRRQEAFRGYRLWGCRSLDVSIFDGRCSWSPVKLNRQLDGDPCRYMVRYARPFAHWAVFERIESFAKLHGPQRFSLLFVGGDGVDVFQRFYYSNGTAPSIVAIIQPGDAFGGNWTRYQDPKQVFARAVLGNRYGTPEHIFYGGYTSTQYHSQWRGAYKQPCWPSHNKLLRFWAGRSMDWRLGLWQAAATEIQTRV